MNKYFLLFFVSLSLFARFESTDSLKILEGLRYPSPEKTLIVLDIDETLTMPKDPTFHWKNFMKFYDEEHIKAWIRPFKKEVKDIAFNRVYAFETQLIEPDAPEILSNLSQRGIKAIALTASLAGPIGQDKPNAIVRRKFLKGVGIDFSKTFPEKHIVLESLKPYIGNHPEYYKGILFQNGFEQNKGDVLCSFLKEIGFIPDLIVVVDDGEHNLKAIQDSLASEFPGIELRAYRFTGAETFDSPRVDIETVHAKFNEILDSSQVFCQELSLL